LNFNFFVPKAFFWKLYTGHYSLNFVGFPFRTSKLKNDINYIKYKFLHRFGKVCRWLNMYYSKIRIITFLKITTMSIWIILKNLIWTYRGCNFCQYWAIAPCIHPSNSSKLPIFRQCFLKSPIYTINRKFCNSLPTCLQTCNCKMYYVVHKFPNLSRVVIHLGAHALLVVNGKCR